MKRPGRQNKLEEQQSWVVSDADAAGRYESYTEESYRTVLDLFESRSRPGPGAGVLEIGCATGAFGGRLARRGYDVTGLDISEQLLRLAPQGRRFCAVAGDAEALPFRSGAFDAVFCADLLHHLPDIRTLVAEGLRVLRPGGVFFISDLNALNPHTYLAQCHGSPVRYDYLTSNESATFPEKLKQVFKELGRDLEFEFVFLERRKRMAVSDWRYRTYGFILPQIRGFWKRALAVALFNPAHWITPLLPARFRANVVIAATTGVNAAQD